MPTLSKLLTQTTPYFKSKQYGQGLVQCVVMITQKVSPNIDLGSSQRLHRSRGSRKPTSPFAVFFRIFIFLALISTRFGRTLLLVSLFSSRSGGGFGGGSGGGFGGGGGGFSGGGASGGW